MFLIIYITMISMFISILMLFTCMMVYKKTTLDREKMSPFECGFDPMSSSRMPFSIQFFLIAMLFLIFDVEIVIMLPMVIAMKYTMISSWFITASLFIIILMLGLYYEWINGVLEWAN